MGWLFWDRRPGETIDSHMREQFTREGTCHILASASVNLTEYYAALQLPDEDRVIALVCLYRYTRDGQIGYKDMDESMGPGIINCPERILDLLTDPAPNEWATEWRAACRAKIAEKKAQPKLKPGMKVRLVGAEKYNGYQRYGDTFTVTTWARYIGQKKTVRCFRSHKSGTLVKYPKSARWEVIEEAA